MALSLDRTPASDTIELTLEVWFDAACKLRTWDRQIDLQRIHRAFDWLAIHAEQWPSPSRFFAALPPVKREYFTALGTDAGAPGKRDIPASVRAVIANLAAKLGVSRAD